MSYDKKLAALYGIKEPDRKDPDSAVHAERKPRAKKDTKRWCRGKEGVAHQPAIARDHSRPQDQVCHWVCRRYGEWKLRTEPHDDHRDTATTFCRWWCLHVKRCTECGKILARSVICPDKKA